MSCTRRVKIISINTLMLEELLAGTSRCVNWPSDAWLEGTIFDLSRNAWLVQISSTAFEEIPKNQQFPEMDLIFERT